MRRILILTTAVLIFVGIIAGTASYTMAANGPYQPGDVLFEAQVVSEQLWGLGLNGDKTNRAEIQLNLLSRRLDELSVVRGTDEELTAVAAVDVAYDRALWAVLDSPETEQQTLQNRLKSLSERALSHLVKLDSVRETAVSDLQAKIASVVARITGEGDTVATLAAISTSTIEDADSQMVAASDGNLLDYPRTVPFPPGTNFLQVHNFFELTGGHADLLCSACHSSETYDGTDSACIACHGDDDTHEGTFGPNCAACHTISSWEEADFDHRIIGTQDCADCHSAPVDHFVGACRDCHADTDDFSKATFNHATIGAQDCAACHEPPANHFAGACRNCHSDTDDFSNAFFNHATIGEQDCAACHAPPANHYQGACRACHSDTNDFRIALFNHATIGEQDCAACHSPPANHYQGACRACHSDTNDFRIAFFNHAVIGGIDCAACHSAPANHYPGACSNCHQDTGNFRHVNFNHAGLSDCQSCHSRPANHFPGQCSSCHNTNTFSGASFNHTFPMNHGGANGQCASCHPGGDTSSYTCTNCHNQQEMAGEHSEEGIGDITNCIRCHADGQEHEGDDGDDHDDGDHGDGGDDGDDDDDEGEDDD